MRIPSALLLGFAALSVLAFTLQEKRIKVYLIGDSTMSIKDPSAYPETGWGMPFARFFDNRVDVDNRAKNGRSTKTFIGENLWQPVASALQPGDFVFMQFGHNDEVKEKVGRYTPPDEYRANLTLFVNETRAKGATPVIISPVARRRFKDGAIQESHPEYTRIAEDVARSLKVAYIDLDKKSRELLQSFGEEQSKLLFLQLKPGEHPNYPDGKDDNTHFNELGARLVAQIVLAEVRNLKLSLSDYIIKPPKKD